PVAAHLSLGITPTNFGQLRDTLVTLSIPQVLHGKNRVEGEVIYTDGFGNLFTNIRERDLTGLPKESLQIALAGVPLAGLVSTYGEVRAGEFACLINSWDVLEIAINKGSVVQRTGAKIGDKVTVNLQQAKS
ncbi:MAG TPA: SAM hydroxide adenosyltransferase, partial [Candidatus Binatia bacterium]|nr:SAM hydroxide adenosyltransferase [Candidatus Binatia bacterium]